MAAEDPIQLSDDYVKMTAGPVAKSPSTQEVHPWRAVVRTFVAAGVGIAIAWLARTFGIDLSGLEGAIADALTATVWALVTGALQWALTRPRFMPFFESIGLGTGVEKD